MEILNQLMGAATDRLPGLMAAVTPQMLLLAAIGLGVLVTFYGVVGAFAGPDARSRRLTALTRASRGGAGDRDALLRERFEASGLLSAFVPRTESERLQVALRLRQAGFNAPGAVRNYYVVRAALAIALPVLFLATVYAPPSVFQRIGIAPPLTGLSATLVFQVVTGLLLLGFYGPALWLKSRIDERRNRIRLALPNALDLLQVAVEAGLGFDAAIQRVAREMHTVCPDLSEEFLMLQLEIQAGKDRDRAFLDMAARVGIDEMTAFSNVILQANQFGMSISDALAIYATEMRQVRELKAQEKANRLPVQMSAILATMMMPTLLLITLTPVLIRWMRVMNTG